MKIKKILINGQEYAYRVSRNNEKVVLSIEGTEYSFTWEKLASAPIIQLSQTRQTWFKENFYQLESVKKNHSKKAGGQSEQGSLKSPMPGKIFKVLRPEGSQVSEGETILILEAMKMEHPIKAPCNGKIEKIFFHEGDTVQGGVELLEVSS